MIFVRLFHVSEEKDISIFIPRPTVRRDLEPAAKYVWAIDESHLPNFLTPRNCPRVCYRANDHTASEDIVQHIGTSVRHVVVIEADWLEKLEHTVLYLYEFDPKDFALQDAAAGYYVSTVTVRPIQKLCIPNLPLEIRKRGVELRTAENLHPIADEIKQSSFDWSLCRMAFAKN